jgi:hypothetical protein
MKKSMWIVVGVVVGIIIISAVFFLLNSAYKNSTDAEVNDTELNESNYALTNATDDSRESNQNLEKIDPNNLSNTICNQLPTSSDFGLDDNYYCLAVVNHNSSFCEKMLGNDAVELGNLEESEEDLNDKTQYYICLSAVSKDFSYCKLVREDAKKTCYNTLAQLSWNIDVCSEIDYDQNDKQQCYFNFVNALYWENKSEEITTEDCDKVGMNGGSLDKNTCLAFKARDVSICESNKNCLTFFHQEMSFCNDATFKNEDECIRDRALTDKDISLCDKLSSQTGKDDCYGDFANHIQQTISICDKIIGIPRKRGCYINTAINLAK